MGRLSRTKGAAYERQIATRMREIYPAAKRGLGQARAGHEVDDVEGTPWWVQTKHTKVLNLLAALSQAKRDADAAKDSRPPLVIGRRDRERDVACMYLDDLIALLKRVEGK